MSKVIVINGAGSGFGALSARALADAGNTVYASIRETAGRNVDRVAEARKYAEEHGVDLRTVELDVSSQDSVDAGIASIIEESGRLDVVIHNAGHMVNGPTEAFTPEELARVYDTNVLGTQRLNRAALPHLREQGSGILLWVGSTSTASARVESRRGCLRPAVAAPPWPRNGRPLASPSSARRRRIARPTPAAPGLCPWGRRRSRLAPVPARSLEHRRRVVRLLVVEPRGGVDRLGRPVDREVSQKLVLGEALLHVAVTVAPGAELLQDPGRQPRRESR